MRKLLFGIAILSLVSCKQNTSSSKGALDSIQLIQDSAKGLEAKRNTDSLEMDRQLSDLAKPVYVNALADVMRIKQDLKLALDGEVDEDGALAEFNDRFGKYMGRSRTVKAAKERLDTSGTAFAEMMFYKEKARIAYKIAAEKQAENL